MHVFSHPDADAELETAAFYYEKCSEGLGKDFIEHFEKTLEQIILSPIQCRKIHGNIRQLRLKRALIKIPAKKGDHKDRPYGAIRRFR